MTAGVLHAPLTAIFLASEISGGYELFVPLMLCAAISYLVSKFLVKNSIYTYELAERGELLTHDKDKNVLTLMTLTDEIETDFIPVMPDNTLGILVRVIAKSQRNLHPVVDKELMVVPDHLIVHNDKMDSVMSKFESSGAWNLPVVDSEGKYMGFVSRSKLFNAYRRWLKASSG
jgi:CIC family chloride channel protein